MSVRRSTFKQLASSFVNDVFSDFAKDFTIEQIHRLPDDQGGYETIWTQFATVKGFIEKSSGGREVERTDGFTKIDSDETFTFQFQFVDGVTNDMRIRYNGEVYMIKGAKAIQEADVWLMIDAKKGEPT